MHLGPSLSTPSGCFVLAPRSQPTSRITAEGEADPTLRPQGERRQFFVIFLPRMYVERLLVLAVFHAQVYIENNTEVGMFQCGNATRREAAVGSETTHTL